MCAPVAIKTDILVTHFNCYEVIEYLFPYVYTTYDLVAVQLFRNLGRS